jgi:CBS domain-containing protein
LGSGTSGGVLAPLLMMGAGLGVMLAPVLPGPDPLLWPLVCMSATLAGVMRAPLTATIFAFELTRNANALLPLIATSAISYGFTVLTMRRSILTEKIARRGYHIYREYGVDPLERVFVEDVMTRDVQTIDASMAVRAALARYFGPDQAHRAFPVVDGHVVVGVVDRAALAAFANDTTERTVGSICADAPLVVALPDETCRMTASRLALHGLERLPVVADEQSMHLVGLVARSDLVKPRLGHIEEEETRERLRRVPWRSPDSDA